MGLVKNKKSLSQLTYGFLILYVSLLKVYFQKKQNLYNKDSYSQ